MLRPALRSAGVSPAGGVGVSPTLENMSIKQNPNLDGASPPQFGAVTIRNRGRLPHWEVDAGVYFITYRLADSLPHDAIERLKSKAIALALVPPAKRKWRHLLTAVRLDRCLDRGCGGCELARPEVAEAVVAALEFFEAKRYRLLAWCVMPNHLHVCLRLFPGQMLDAIVHSWKSFTAHRANSLLGRTGAFWQREYYDHLVRNGRELDHVIRYIQNNPLRAGLNRWKWVDVRGRDARVTAGGTPALQ